MNRSVYQRAVFIVTDGNSHTGLPAVLCPLPFPSLSPFSIPNIGSKDKGPKAPLFQDSMCVDVDLYSTSAGEKKKKKGYMPMCVCVRVHAHKYAACGAAKSSSKVNGVWKSQDY